MLFYFKMGINRKRVCIMKFVIAPDSFKGSLTAEQVCDNVEKVAKINFPDAEVIKLPISDGGEGLVNSLLKAQGGERIEKKVQDPLGRRINAFYGILKNKTAIIEMAAASGLPLIRKEEQNPMKTSTFGTGQLMVDALKHGCTKIILGIGGSATVDGGMGAAAALGVRFLDQFGNEVPLCGEGLEQVDRIDIENVPESFLKATITIACDVDNPLCGEVGSAAVYGPQKGANAVMIKNLDSGLNHLGEVIYKETGKVLNYLSGIGAAGGFGLPWMAFFNTNLKPGLEIVLDVIDFDQKIKNADLIITGEGRTDEQSAMGKVVSGISKRGKIQGIPVVAISGALESGYESLYEDGLTAAFSACTNTRALDWQIEHAEASLSRTAQNLFRLVKGLKKE